MKNEACLLTQTIQKRVDKMMLEVFTIGEDGTLGFVAESLNLLNHTNVVALDQFYGAGGVPSARVWHAERSGHSEAIAVLNRFRVLTGSRIRERDAGPMKVPLPHTSVRMKGLGFMTPAPADTRAAVATPKTAVLMA
jgi:hypothetical protein